LRFLVGSQQKHAVLCQNKLFWSKQMKNRRHFDTYGFAAREAAQIEIAIAKFDRSAKLLDCDVVTEEQRTGISDPAQPGYSILAVTLAARRDNLRATVGALEQRLAKLQAEQPEMA
jgi:hypothetical protein